MATAATAVKGSPSNPVSDAVRYEVSPLFCALSVYSNQKPDYGACVPFCPIKLLDVQMAPSLCPKTLVNVNFAILSKNFVFFLLKNNH